MHAPEAKQPNESRARARARLSERALVAMVALATPALLSGSSVQARDAVPPPLPALEPSSLVTISAATGLPAAAGFEIVDRATAARELAAATGLPDPDVAAPGPATGRDEVRARSDAALADLLVASGAQPARYTPASFEPRPAPSPELSEGSDLRVVTEGEIGRGRTLSQALRAEGIPASVVHVIAREMRPVFDFRRCQPGDRFRLVQDPDGGILRFRYRTEPTVSFELRRQGDGFVARRVDEELVPRVERLAGIVTSTLYESVLALGERGSLANDFVGIFAWDLDFSRGTRPGDEFDLVYERLYRTRPDGEWVYVRPGRILAARYESALHGRLEAFYFEHEPGQAGYFRRDGSAVERQFLASPLRASRMTSSYSSARRHPILKVTRPHWGIDYAAPAGTPAYAVADGEVIYRGWMGGFGKLVKIRHSNDYVSYYAHLSRFADELAVGSRVSQKQVIGYVGKTGLATGPHVCFRVKKDGRWVNPLRLESPAAAPVPEAARARFESLRDLLLAQLDGAALAAVDEAL